MEALLIYCLAIWSTFFFLNYAAISACPAAWLKKVLGPTVGYPLSCAYCYCGWISIGFWLMGVLNIPFLLAAPVIHLFIDLVYSKLSEQVPPCL